MVNKYIVINKYSDEHYSTYFNQKTGLFVRLEEKGFKEPICSAHGPELLDISITNWCDKYCAFCYMGSHRSGSHMPLKDYSGIIRQAGELGVLQVALGGGNPNQHPDFTEILRATREQYNIVPSYTTNGRGLDAATLIASKRYCGAVAVSFYSPLKEFSTAVKQLINYGIRTNIHFLLDSKSVNTAISWLKSPQELLAGINALIFLNYKPIGPGRNSDLLLNKSKNLAKLFNLVNHGVYPFKIGFDSCSVSGIAKHLRANPNMYDFCDGGRFSAYISEDLRMFPCSFMREEYTGEDLRLTALGKVWSESRMFKQWRKYRPKGECRVCSSYESCRGGCRLLPEINLCD